MKDRDTFMKSSRFLAALAQKREGSITQPKEMVDGTKAIITITNWLKGNYFFTCDETKIEGNTIFLIEAKHSDKGNLPGLGDIKDGLIKMDLFSNLHEVFVGDKKYRAIPVLKLTVSRGFKESSLTDTEKIFFDKLKKEAEINGFQIRMG